MIGFEICTLTLFWPLFVFFSAQEQFEKPIDRGKNKLSFWQFHLRVAWGFGWKQGALLRESHLLVPLCPFLAVRSAVGIVPAAVAAILVWLSLFSRAVLALAAAIFQAIAALIAAVS